MFKQTVTSVLALGIFGAALAETNADLTVPLQDQESILDSKSYVDTYDPTAGPYGGDNVFAAPTFSTGNVMPDLSAPTGVGTFVAERVYQGTKKNPEFTLSSDLTCDTFKVTTWTTLRIENDVTLVVNDNFSIENQSKIVLAPDASLTIYCLGDASIQNQTHVNPDSTRPGDVIIVKLGEKPLYVADQSSLTAAVVIPKAPLVVQNGSDFYGMVLAKSLTVENTAAAHLTAFTAAIPTTTSPLYD